MPEGPSKAESEKILEEARTRFKLVNEAEGKQRTRETEDLRFIVPENQWDDDARAQRAGGTVPGTGATVPARPIISIPKIHQPIQMIENQEKSSKLGIRVHPLSEEANRETAKVIQGLIRKIERDSNAHQGRSWAFKRAVQAGRGAYRVDLVYDDEGGHAFDMKIVIDRILHQENVFFDPSAQLADWSDGEWAFNAAWVPADRFKRDFPKSRLSSADRTEWQAAHSEAPEWVKAEGRGLSDCLVAEYFYKEYVNEHIILVKRPDGSGQTDALVVPKGEKVPKGVEIVKERERKVPIVQWVKMTGLEVIEGKTWPGKYIPLIPTVGRELIPFDGERIWHGVVRPSRGPQKMYNHAASSLIELAALEPRAPWLISPDQIAGYEAWWLQSNTRNFPYLPYNPTGQNASPPQRVQIDASRLGPSMMMLQQADDMIQSSTSTPQASLGDLPSKERSGKAIQALQGQSDEANSDWLQNLAQISMLYEAKVILDLIPVAYERPGRVAEILEDDAGKARSVMLNIPFQDQGGRPQAANPNAPGVKRYDLKAGAYGVSVNIGKSYQSRLQAGADEIGHILSQQPDLMPIIGPIYFRFRDFPGSEEIADDLRALRDVQHPGVFDEQEATPEQIKLMAQRMKRENMQLKQQLQGAVKQLETDAVKTKAGLQKAQIDAQSRAQVAELEGKLELMVQQAKDEADRREQALDQVFEAKMKQLEQLHERQMQREKSASEERQAEIRKRETRAGGAD